MLTTEDEFSNIKLFNFGLAKSLKDIDSFFYWKSPEAYNGVFNQPESDIWSLGGTIIEMVALYFI